MRKRMRQIKVVIENEEKQDDRNKDIPPKIIISSSVRAGQMKLMALIFLPLSLPLTHTRAHTYTCTHFSLFSSLSLPLSASQLEPTRAALVTSPLTGERRLGACIVCIQQPRPLLLLGNAPFFCIHWVPSRNMGKPVNTSFFFAENTIRSWFYCQ